MQTIKALQLAATMLVTLSSVGIGMSVFGPYVGLGSGEEFLFYEHFGVPRHTLLINSVWLFCAAAIVWLGIRTWVHWASVSKDGGAEPASDKIGPLAVKFYRVVREQFPGTKFKILYSMTVRAVAAVVTINRTHRNWAVVALLTPVACYVLGFYFFSMPNVSVLAGDSGTYISFSTYRTIGYPLFIRLAALLSNSPSVIATVQVLLGVIAILLLAEGLQRVFQNYIFSFAIGWALLMNCNFLIYAWYILSDYMFFTFIVLHFASFLFVMEKPTAFRLAVMSVCTIIAIAIRPIGVSLFLTIPILMLVFPNRRWRVVVYHVVPLGLLTGALMATHYIFFDYFALSRFGGYNTGQITMFLMSEEAVARSEHPKLARRLLDSGRPYQEALARQPTIPDKFLFISNQAAPMINRAHQLVAEYVKENQALAVHSDTRRHRNIVGMINELSPLNKDLGKIGVGANSIWITQNNIMASIGRDAYLTNPIGFIKFSWAKFVAGWRALIVYATVPKEFTSPILQPKKADIGSSETVTLPIGYSLAFSAWPINLTGKILYVFGQSLSGAWWLFGFGAAISVWVAVRTAMRRHISIQAYALFYHFAGLLGYVILVVVATIPINRYLLVYMPATLVVLLSPLLFLSWLPASTGWARAACSFAKFARSIASRPLSEWRRLKSDDVAS